MGPETLYHIWSLTSRSEPGLFNQLELVQALGLIGLAQRSQWSSDSKPLLNLEELYKQTIIPVPTVQIPKCFPNDPSPFIMSKHEFQPPVLGFSTSQEFGMSLTKDELNDNDWSDFTSFKNVIYKFDLKYYYYY